ncbi:MAG: amidase [Fuerstiella sp.]
MLNLFPEFDETIHGCAAALRAKTTSCVALLDRCLTRIDQWEALVHAWVSIDRETARQTAYLRDRELADGHDRGPLHGIPLGIKDIFDVAGHVTAAGSTAWSAHEPKASDCPVVSRLRDAGAIIIGKTVTTQFACFDPPVTRNPWNRNHTPGGSSSGSAAAVATGMCLAAIGSQTGGSITRPSTYCGIAGCKPSYGTVSLRGVVAVAEHLDHPGPMARCVTDLAILLNVIRDSPDAAFISSAADIPPRIGWIHGLFGEEADDDAREAVANAVKTLSAAGASIVDVPLPHDFDSVLEQHGIIMAVEAAQTHRDHFAADPDDYSPAIRDLIERGMATSQTRFMAALDHRQQLCRGIDSCFMDVDVLICPATTGTAPDRSTTGSPAMNSPFSFTGLPTVSIPTQCAGNGLPLAVQLVGRIRDDSTLLKSAIWCESQLAAANREP